MISQSFQDEVWNKLNSIERRLISISTGGAPSDAEFVVMSLHATLTAERRLQASEGIALADGGAGNDADLTLDINGLVEDAAGASGDFFVYYDTVAGDHKKIDWDDMPGGGGGDVTAAANLADDYVTRGDGGVKGIQDSLLYLTDAGLLCLNETANALMTIGLTINQGANDDEAFALKSSDVAHGCTTYADTDTYFRIGKLDAARGGTLIRSFVETGIDQSFLVQGYATTFDTVFGTNTVGTCSLDALKISGTGRTGVDANAIIFSIRAFTGAGSFSRFQVDEDGDTWQPGVHFINETSNVEMTKGLTIHGSSGSQEMVALKGTGVNHGYTTWTETDTYARFHVEQSGSGGHAIDGLTELGNYGLVLSGWVNGTWDTAKSTAAKGAVQINSYARSGTTNIGVPTANGNILVITSGSAKTARWLVDVEGDTWQGGGITAEGIPSGATQVAAGASANEFWETSGHASLPDHVLMIGV